MLIIVSQDQMKMLETTKEFSKLFGVHQQKSTLRLTRELVTSRYQNAVTEWGSVIARVDGPNSHETLTASEARAEDNLAAWLEGLRVEGDEDEEDQKWCAHPTTNMNSVALYRCSYCGNPSAVLRKCSGCNKTRYVSFRVCEHWRASAYDCTGTATPAARRCTGRIIKLRAKRLGPSPESLILTIKLF